MCWVQGGGSDGENPKAAAIREQLRKRLGEQEEKERATKTELGQKAASYLEQFYEVSTQSPGIKVLWVALQAHG